MSRIIFKQVEDKVFVTEPWPEIAEFAQEFFFVPSERVSVEDLTITLTVDNGMAIYQIIKVNPVFGTYTAELVASLFKPEYSFATEVEDG